MTKIKSLMREFGSIAALAVAFVAGSGTASAQFVGQTPLTLINGWYGAPFSTSLPSVEEVSGIVHFKGSMATTGTNPEAFVLPASLRPTTAVYVPVDLCAANNGRLYIQPSGVVTVQAEGGAFNNAQCFTSLDGASFALTTTGFSALTLINGWSNAPFGTSKAEAALISSIVHFKGAIATTGTSAEPFVLPASLRPSTDVYVPVDLCNATNGRLWIQPSGVVTVMAETAFSNAQCFTSLDGAWFARSNLGYTISLNSGWGDAPYGTNEAKAAETYGIVSLQGAIDTSGTNAEPFVLPASLRPVTTVYVPVDLCNSAKGRLIIDNTGVVQVQAQTSFSSAQCFTSLDGASFVQ